VDAPPRRSPSKTPAHNQQTLLKKWGNPDFEDKPVGLIKCWKPGLDNLLVNSCLQKRIRRKAQNDYRRSEHKNPPYPAILGENKSLVESQF